MTDKKIVKPFGNGAHVIVGSEHLGKKATITYEEMTKEDYTFDKEVINYDNNKRTP